MRCALVLVESPAWTLPFQRGGALSHPPSHNPTPITSVIALLSSPPSLPPIRDAILSSIEVFKVLPVQPGLSLRLSNQLLPPAAPPSGSSMTVLTVRWGGGREGGREGGRKGGRGRGRGPHCYTSQKRTCHPVFSVPSCVKTAKWSQVVVLAFSALQCIMLTSRCPACIPYLLSHNSLPYRA